MISRRGLLASLAALPLLGAARLDAQARRVGGARILVRDNRLWIQVRFGDRGPLAFVIDTGAAISLIRKDVARLLALRELNAVRLMGVGGTQEFRLYEARNVTIGTTDLGTINFGGYEQETLPIHPEAAGALSASMLSLADSDLDFDSGEWRIYPDGRGEREGYSELSSAIPRSARRMGATPIMVDAAIDGVSYRLHLDTGAPIGISLDSDAVRRRGLWNDSRPFSPGRRRGIGGLGARTRLVRAGELRLGDIAFPRPLVSLGDPEHRGRTSSDGILGLPVIALMNLSTEVARGKLWARRNAQQPPPERYGMSGLWVEEGEGGLVVAQASPSSPASEAGLRTGDVITGVPLADFVRRLGGRPGDRIEIAYRRGAEARSTSLTLRPFL
jgi:hypothetical protein